MFLKYDGKVVGEITTNRNLTLEECFDILGIDVTETDAAGDPKYDYALFEMDYNK